MGDILILGADHSEGRITRLRIALDRLPERVVDRATALQWLSDGHSLIPFAGRRLAALQRVAGPDGEPYVRTDNNAVAEDALPELPAAQ